MVPSTAQTEIEDSCNKIIKNVRSTRLNYGIPEMPHSIYLTIRKSLSEFSRILEPSFQSSTNSVNSKSHCESYTIELEKLIKTNENLKHLYEDATIEVEEKIDYIIILEDKVQIMYEKLAQAKSSKEIDIKNFNKMKAIEEEKRLLQVKHEKLCAELKIWKGN